MEFTPETLSKNERSALMYAEACTVDNSGLLEAIRMNGDDFAAFDKFKAAGILNWGRVPAHSQAFDKGRTHWVTLSDTGWELAAKCRRFRSLQIGPWRREVDAMLAEKEPTPCA